MISILLVENSKLSIETIESRIKKSDKYSIDMIISNAANAEIACMSENFDLILMDICTADDESGIKAASKIKEMYPDIKIIAITSMPETSFVENAKKAGCDSFWYKEYDNMDLIDICDRTMNNENIWLEKKPIVRVGVTDTSHFTDRELEVMRLIAFGLKYSEIADKLCVSRNTIKYHIKNLLKKTGYANTVQLAVDIVEKQLVLPSYSKDFTDTAGKLAPEQEKLTDYNSYCKNKDRT